VKLTLRYNPQKLGLTFTAPKLTLTTGKPVARQAVERDPYEGSYEVTPSSEAQILPTDGLRMTADLVINPIPSNYGLITWNGLGIRVS